jgi:hypothetical protein
MKRSIALASASRPRDTANWMSAAVDDLVPAPADRLAT